MKLYIKYTVSGRCLKIVQDRLNALGLNYHGVNLGEVEVKDNITPVQRNRLRNDLLKAGFELMDNKKNGLIEKIKAVINDIVYNYDDAVQINNSDFLISKLNYDYTYMANLFSETTGITIEQYIISQRIERVKELLIYEELSLTEISHRLNYCSVAHLSQQFKKVTGLTPTFFKNLKERKSMLT